MKEKILQQSIDRLYITDETTNILKESNIKTIGQLCQKSKSELRNINLMQNDIHKVEVELQLLGLRLKNSF